MAGRLVVSEHLFQSMIIVDPQHSLVCILCGACCTLHGLLLLASVSCVKPLFIHVCPVVILSILLQTCAFSEAPYSMVLTIIYNH